MLLANVFDRMKYLIQKEGGVREICFVTSLQISLNRWLEIHTLS